MTASTPAFFPNRRKRHLDASPLPRHFHGPQSHTRLIQRLRRGFLLLPPEARSLAFDMGNYISRAFGRPSDDGRGLFSRWVRKRQGLTVAMDEEAGTGLPFVDRRRVTDPTKVTLEAEAVKPQQWKKRVPYYKKAYEATTQYNRRLEEIGIDVKFQEEKLSEIWKSDKAVKEDLSELFKPLTAEEENEVHDCFHSRGPSSKVLALHEPSNIEISKEKFQCLRPRCWLNDEVINLYLELLKEREKREPKRFLKCHFFNTFFYKKLACGKNGYDYKSVKRWTSHKKLGYELVECDKIFVPVHKDVHWCLAIINMKENTFQYLDSLGGMDHNVPRVLAQYISEEVKDKSNRVINTSSWHEELVDDIPLQQNGWDCGMFMLKYIDFHSRGLPLSFSQEHMEYFRKRTAKEILRLRAD
ncbi:putative ubiquitin-like-specific protease 1B isoform X1 [Miscanthus floridulus]|uniref:putative ubiquitin-like-specific protease 1B isoform X1 n=1 Tax=Miscanthus floridulus TaxID=154761 RepID=UPI0034594AC1